MSYDTSIRIPGWPEDIDLGNYTWNCSPMLEACTGGRTLNDMALASDCDGRAPGMPCPEAAAILSDAVTQMRADPERFRAMNPPNGWGDYDTWVEYLDRIARACAAFPQGTLMVC